jgi:hypothetical protein
MCEIIDLNGLRPSLDFGSCPNVWKYPRCNPSAFEIQTRLHSAPGSNEQLVFLDPRLSIIGTSGKIKCIETSAGYEALQEAISLNSDGRASICLKHSCPQPSRIGQREHSLSRRQGLSKIA